MNTEQMEVWFSEWEKVQDLMKKLSEGLPLCQTVHWPLLGTLVPELATEARAFNNLSDHFVTLLLEEMQSGNFRPSDGDSLDYKNLAEDLRTYMKEISTLLTKAATSLQEHQPILDQDYPWSNIKSQILHEFVKPPLEDFPTIGAYISLLSVPWDKDIEVQPPEIVVEDQVALSKPKENILWICYRACIQYCAEFWESYA